MAENDAVQEAQDGQQNVTEAAAEQHAQTVEPNDPPNVPKNEALNSTSSELPTPAAAAPSGDASSSASAVRPRKGPFSFLSGSLTSFGFGWLALQLSSRVVAYYGTHPPHYEARFAQSIAVFMKTLIVGMTFLATFTFAFVGLGLFLTFLRSLMPGWQQAEDTP